MIGVMCGRKNASMILSDEELVAIVSFISYLVDMSIKFLNLLLIVDISIKLELNKPNL